MLDNMGYFKTLPTEILEIVLSHLDAPALSSMSCTCRKLRELSSHVWKSLCKCLSLEYTPSPLCIASRSVTSSLRQYDQALKECSADETKWRIIAIRSWLYCRWKCVICYRTCSKRTDPHRDVLLCESCHPLFYRRKSNAKVSLFLLTLTTLTTLTYDLQLMTYRSEEEPTPHNKQETKYV